MSEAILQIEEGEVRVRSSASASAELDTVAHTVVRRSSAEQTARAFGESAARQSTKGREVTTWRSESD